MSSPRTVEGRRWLSEATEGLAALRNAVGEERVIALRGSVRALQHLLHDEPSYAADIQELVLSPVCLLKTIEPEVALRFGDVGLRASLLLPDPTSVDATRTALLEVNLAEALILAGRYGEAESTLDSLDHRTAGLGSRGAISRFLEAASDCLRGRIYEEGLELEKAAAAYQAALAASTPLLSRAAQRTKVVGAWMEAVVGPVETGQRIAAAALVVRETLAPVYVWALLGRGRVARGEADDAELSALLRRTLKALEEYGLPAGLRVHQLAATAGLVAAHLGAEKALAFVRAITNEDLDEAHLLPDADRPVLVAAIAHSAASKGNDIAANVLYQNALQAALDTGSKVTMARVLGRFVGDMIHEPDQDNDLIESFLRNLTVWGFSAAPLSEKAEFEDALSTVVDYALALWNEQRAPSDRMRLAILLDLLKRPQWVPLPSRWDLDPQKEDVRSLAGLWFAMDWLGRLQLALRRHPDTGVIVIRSGRSRTLFLCAGGRQNDLVPSTAWTDSREATNELARAARDELDFVLMSGVVAGGDFEGLCKAAFRELPDAVRAFIRQHDVLIVVPDARTDAESAPFELLHDGDGYLGTTKVVSRVPSLRDLVRVLESGARILSKKRGLVAAVPAAEGLPSLLYAAAEADHVRLKLEAEGWDVPVVEKERLGPAYVLDRLQHVAVAHLAAHGVSTAGDEALLLPARQRLTTEFLLQRRPARLPFVYLNSCFLGTTRYLGGGARRGLAHAFTELGAPAVVASLNPVDDRLAALLSAAFYDEALAHPVGEALRRARARLAERGVPAPLWGTTVLFGDPDLRLFGADAEPTAEPDRVDQLLDSFANPEPTHWALDRYPADAVLVNHEEPDDPRLRAAAMLVDSLVAAESVDDPRAELHFAVELADQLGHAPSRALVRLKEATHLDAHGRSAEALSVLEGALPILDALHEIDSRWAEIRVQVYGLWKRIDRRQSGESELVLESDGTQDELEARLNEILGSQAIAERGGGEVGFRIPEQSLAEIAWNAVRLGHPWEFTTLRARCEVAGQLAAKLERSGFVPAGSTVATTLLTGILDYLWKGLAPLDGETMRRSTAVLLRAIDDIRGPWTSSPDEPWFDAVLTFQAEVRSSARMADLVPAQGLQPALREYRKSLTDTWRDLADRLAQEHPLAVAGCSAFIMGAIIEAHADAPDGPLRDNILAHLTALLSSVSDSNEHTGRLQGYEVDRGSSDVDELERWRREEGLTGDAATPVRFVG